MVLTTAQWTEILARCRLHRQRQPQPLCHPHRRGSGGGTGGGSTGTTGSGTGSGTDSGDRAGDHCWVDAYVSRPDIHVSGLTYIPDFVTHAEADRYLQRIHVQPFANAIARRQQFWGQM